MSVTRRLPSGILRRGVILVDDKAWSSKSGWARYRRMNAAPSLARRNFSSLPFPGGDDRDSVAILEYLQANETKAVAKFAVRATMQRSASSLSPPSPSSAIRQRSTGWSAFYSPGQMPTISKWNVPRHADQRIESVTAIVKTAFTYRGTDATKETAITFSEKADTRDLRVGSLLSNLIKLSWRFTALDLSTRCLTQRAVVSRLVPEHDFVAAA